MGPRAPRVGAVPRAAGRGRPPPPGGPARTRREFASFHHPPASSCSCQHLLTACNAPPTDSWSRPSGRAAAHLGLGLRWGGGACGESGGGDPRGRGRAREARVWQGPCGGGEAPRKRGRGAAGGTGGVPWGGGASSRGGGGRAGGRGERGPSWRGWGQGIWGIPGGGSAAGICPRDRGCMGCALDWPPPPHSASCLLGSPGSGTGPSATSLPTPLCLDFSPSLI